MLCVPSQVLHVVDLSGDTSGLGQARTLDVDGSSQKVFLGANKPYGGAKKVHLGGQVNLLTETS